MSSFVPNVENDDLSLDEPLPLNPPAKPEDIQIEYVDNRPETEQRYEVNTVDPNATNWTPEDKRKYGKNVRQRMGQMDYRIHQAEREREQAVRERQAIEEHARGLSRQLQELKAREQQWGDVAVDATRQQVEQQITSVKSDIARMLQSPNPDVTKVVDAQERLSTLAAQRAQVSQLTRPAVQAPAAAAPSQQGAQGPPAHPNYNFDRDRWLAVNPWFGKDVDKTQRLVAIEQQLVQNGVLMGSRAYWDAVERAKQMVMNNTNGQGPQQAGSPSQRSQTRPVVNGSSQGGAPGAQGNTVSTGGRRVVQLSQDERRAAARMGVSEQEWAMEKLKRQEKQRENGRL
jgi:hypothetical protein